MDIAKQHWEILQGLGTDLANRVREYMVIGEEGEGVIVATEDGLVFWLGEMKFVLGELKTATELTPLDVPGLVSMAHGNTHILFLNKRGMIYAMGQNYCGQFGLGTVDLETHFSPQLIPSSHKFISVQCGDKHSVALTEDGKCWAWGSNDWGQLGVPSSTLFFSSPRQIAELDPYRVVAVECGGRHSLALTDRGEVYGWGMNYWGQLCGEGWLPQHTPNRILTPSPVQSMAAGNYHTLLLTQTGEVWASGWNGGGQLGLPTETEFSFSLSKVAGLPFISQIASHHSTDLSIAISSEQRCFVSGQLRDGKLEENYISISTPHKLPPVYSKIELTLASFSSHRSTPKSVSIPKTPLSPLSVRMSQMFDNPETSPDVQFVVEQRTIHAHRIILSNSSDYLAGMFYKRWLAPVDPDDPIVRVTIPDHSYSVFHAFLRFLYTDSLEVHFDLLPQLFQLASEYLESDLQELCLTRMRTTLTPTTCCLYYPLTHRHSLLPELATFQQELVQFASTRMSEVENSAAYHSMEPDLCSNLTNAVQNFLGSLSKTPKPRDPAISSFPQFSIKPQ